MTQPTHDAFPASALQWLAPEAPGRLLAIGRASQGLATRLHRLGHQPMLAVRAVTPGRAPRTPGIPILAAAAESLPFRPCVFDAITIANGFHLLAPGLALAEFARVLSPSGRLSVVRTVRDDTVPWVKRLAALLQAIDPEAMRPDPYAGTSSVAASPYFPAPERRDFRMWVPITKPALVGMVSRSPRIAELAEPERSDLLAEVATLYDTSARPSGPLLLPYRASCWRARVDHAEFTGRLSHPTEGLRIRL